ncbi:unnamed protein product [Diatraea saccharalis]|uniref:Jumonji domain-containing protein 4 n=1 Tax=Diatraea saccharalis TaxID=40085 RepID=A0A9N9WA51_9NEOP|nr:unnamed protein product [Diatraea saccharalis]
MSELVITRIHRNNVVENNYENCTIETIEKSICYNDFFEKFMMKNLPCIIKEVSVNWECAKKWVNNDTIDYNYISDAYGDFEAPVANCKNVAYNAHCKNNMKVSEYMAYLKIKSDQLLYLKDWHLRRLKPLDSFYEVPMLFASDWLNEFCEDQHEDDFMFVYIGPKCSWTPLHADVYCSYSWSVNVVGRKKWILFPPGEEKKLKDKLGNLPMLFDSEIHKGIKYFEITQEKGDAIFIPSGWFHQVLNIFDTISINHNWINGCNIKKVWETLETQLISVENEIAEFRTSEDFTLQCQLILKSVFGMDFKMFIAFICHIGKKRLLQIESKQSRVFGKYILGINHIKFDLNNVICVMDLIANHSLFIDSNVIPLQMQKDFFALKELLVKNNISNNQDQDISTPNS